MGENISQSRSKIAPNEKDKERKGLNANNVMFPINLEKLCTQLKITFKQKNGHLCNEQLWTRNS